MALIEEADSGSIAWIGSKEGVALTVSSANTTPMWKTQVQPWHRRYDCLGRDGVQKQRWKMSPRSSFKLAESEDVLS